MRTFSPGKLESEVSKNILFWIDIQTNMRKISDESEICVKLNRFNCIVAIALIHNRCVE